ncbi:hypothetical protein LMG28688_02638 [Paraburkholderia caffeinitolerans]|uniref:PAAR motif-containing protein n=1 Tax=Paraburkholderia caffeinitolerans TaxID=1723730 RepID=A0A6J5FVF1_9BURK|nr:MULTISPECIES: PAAR domain-containing protein [Paraburkholderia]CAB3788192.1 hypothetical protein LMG28688_02638 [Paraburkholderia caffeinitolerans]
MKRAILRLGDTTTAGGHVLEGIDRCSHQGVAKTFIGARIWCPVCKTEGVIGWRGPHRTSIMMGKQQALDGDICICKCDPPPVCLASQDTAWHTFTDEEVENYGESRTASATAQNGAALFRASPTGRLDGNEDESPYPAAATNNVQPADCSYLDGTKGRIDAPADFYRHTNNVVVSAGKPTTFDFPGGGAGPATLYQTTVDGHSLDIYTPVHGPADGFSVPDGTAIAKSLETIPSRQLQNLSNVSVNPEANPQDALWQKIYNKPDFLSAATASINQGIAFYPWRGWTTIPQQYIDSTMLHETGHLWSEALWADQTKKQQWLDAIASDGRAPSDYARSNANEDFAETSNMYWSSKGTPCEAEGRKRYPARYAYFDSITK